MGLHTEMSYSWEEIDIHGEKHIGKRVTWMLWVGHCGLIASLAEDLLSEVFCDAAYDKIFCVSHMCHVTNPHRVQTPPYIAL